jgi:hypothetical protein
MKEFVDTHTLMNSIGQTAAASTPPAMQPAVIAPSGFLDFCLIFPLFLSLNNREIF